MLSSCESEYMAYVEACHKAVSMKWLISELTKEAIVMTFYCDNQGALFLLRNHWVSHCTKNIDICQHFIREGQKQKVMIREFVCSKNNMADGVTKNQIIWVACENA